MKIVTRTIQGKQHTPATPRLDPGNKMARMPTMTMQR
jgi:hypothetical protein